MAERRHVRRGSGEHHQAHAFALEFPEQSLDEQLRAVEPILPKGAAELRWFTALSLTAGICEEILFRGYLIWYLDSYIGLVGAVILSSIAFGSGSPLL